MSFHQGLPPRCGGGEMITFPDEVSILRSARGSLRISIHWKPTSRLTALKTFSLETRLPLFLHSELSIAAPLPALVSVIKIMLLCSRVQGVSTHDAYYLLYLLFLLMLLVYPLLLLLQILHPEPYKAYYFYC